MSTPPRIRLQGVAQNNLKGFDLDLPTGSLIVVTGPSGSGKSSLAFDTVYAEGQRRYVETFSPYTRQFLDRMDKPRVGSIEGIPPAIAIEQGNSVKSTRSTVGTITEINDYLKLLMTRSARASCPDCGAPVSPESPESVVSGILGDLAGRTLLVTFPVATGGDLPDGPEGFLDFLREQGYLRIWIDGEVHRTDGEASLKKLPSVVRVIQDRIAAEAGDRNRITEAVETAMRLGKGRVELIEAATGEIFPHSSGWHCARCDREIRPPSPGLFSFNNPLGACPECRGFGRVIGIDYDRVMPDRSLSIAGGVVKPFQSGQSRECQQELLKACADRDIDVHLPFEELPKADQRFVIEGDKEADLSGEELWQNGLWYGIDGFFRWMERRTYKMHVRVFLSRYRAYKACPACDGGRFQPEALVYRLPLPAGAMTLPEIASTPVSRLATLLRDLPLPAGDEGAAMLLTQVVSRLGYLDAVGLGYLTLDRATRTLSGGEVERVNLTTCLGASLVNTLFVMDEPSVGLHPRDVGRLLGIMKALRDKGNTLLVVEHEEAVIRAADHVVDLGPGRGDDGGDLMFSGPLGALPSAEKSLTAAYLRGEKSVPVPGSRRKPRRWIEAKGIRHNNLDNVDIRFPLGVFCCVTGVSGSGKSSLVRDVLYRNLSSASPEEGEAAGLCRSLRGGDHLSDVVLVDQSPLSRTPRSTPAVYLGVFDSIRELFAMEDASLEAGLGSSAFSFNSGQGRCDRCAGLGFEKVEMQFLSDLFLRCPECDGKRYQERVLSVKHRGKSIHDVLEMTASEAIEFFSDGPKAQAITGPLRILAEVGLDYLKLGQPLNVLSGGESQRLKLAARLAGQEPGGALLIFDEPTTGLHVDDVAVLLKAFDRLVREGNSLLVIEHNLDVIKTADWVLDIGPEAGAEGGRLVVEGTPEQVAACGDSHTGRHLGSVLAGRPPLQPEESLPALKISTSREISIRGAREHNLKGIDIDIPRDGMTVVTGLSGSGKSTLAFDILFAEGQRRFLDSMSPYARQFVQQLEKPDVDSIEGLPPSVAIEQRITRGGGKSTVATVTEVHQFLRLLFSKLGTQHCPDCGVPVRKSSLTAVADEVAAMAKESDVKLYANLVRGRKGYHTDQARWASEQGFTTLLVDGAEVAVEEFTPLERFREHTIDVLVGTVTKGSKKGILDLARRALEIGKGTAKALPLSAQQAASPAKGKKARSVSAPGGMRILSSEMNCPDCGLSFEELDPRLFSFNSPHGWCGHCRGFGEVWSEIPKVGDFDSQLEADLAAERSFENREEGETRPCPVCQGDRLNPVACAVRIHGESISGFSSLPAAEALAMLGSWSFAGRDATVARDILPEIRQRLEFLGRVGLDYLQLNRSAKTLSGGESQRIRLASQLGSNLRGVLYVLDEPTIGLHPRDNGRLLDALAELAQQGNSLVVVEHDEETMRRADRIVDLGPRAGSRGGEIVACGTVAEIMREERSLTGQFLLSPPVHPSRGSRRSLADVDWIELKGATLHNLRGVDVRFPLRRLTAITGISGSGKSTLLRGVLLPAVEESIVRSGRKKKAGPRLWKSLSGIQHLSQVIEVDQSPIGKTSRSTPATYLKVFDSIRNLYAGLPEARMRGFTASRFSFNNQGGRCETCEGQGVIRLEMNFLPVSYMPCEDCGGARFNRQTLEVKYDGKSIGDVLSMTVEEAAGFFAAHPKIRRPLSLLVETGLGYLRLGQPSPTLSGGEAQRIKLVTQLARGSTVDRPRAPRKGGILYILEEPTIGLHASDVVLLQDVFHRLVDEGHTVIVVEHHLDLVAEADHIVDVGPEAGKNGGRIIASGTPEEVAKSKASRTAPFLKEVLGRKGPQAV